MKDQHVVAFIAAWFITDGIPVQEAIETATNVLLAAAVALGDAEDPPQEVAP